MTEVSHSQEVIQNMGFVNYSILRNQLQNRRKSYEDDVHIIYFMYLK